MSESPNDLPVGWAACVLADVADLVRGIAFPSTAKSLKPAKDLIACLRTTNVQETVEWDDLWWVPKEFVKRAEQIVRQNDILISVANSPELVGKVALVRELVAPATLGAFIALVRSSVQMDARCLYYFLASPTIQSQFRAAASTTVNISNLNSGKVRTLRVPVAPAVEQTRIADALDELLSDLDAGVAALEQARAKLKQYRASVLKAAVDGTLTAEWRAAHPNTEPASELLNRILVERRRGWEEEQLRKFKEKSKEPLRNWKAKYKEPIPPNDVNLPRLPEGWSWAAVDQLCGLVTKGTSPGWQGFRYQESGVAFLRSQNVRWGRLDLSDLEHLPNEFNDSHRSSIVESGDVLLNLVGASIGRCAVAVPELKGANLNQAVGILRLVSPGLERRWLLVYLLSNRAQAHIHSTKADVARANFNLDDARPMPIAVPPIGEQAALIDLVDSQLSVVDHLEGDLEHKLANARSLRQAILSHAIKGRLVLQNPNDEAASELLRRIATDREAQHRTRERPGRKHRGTRRSEKSL